LDKLLIKGNSKLSGEVKISGSKNASLPILFATLLTDEKIILQNIPNLRDINTTVQLLEYLGKKVEKIGDEIIITQTNQIKTEAPYELVKQMRASVLVIGPVLAKYGKVKVSLPGGCAIGSRPIDIHLCGFQKLCASVDLSNGYVKLKVIGQKLCGTTIILDYPSVGATENLIMAAVLADGITILENTAKEPEIDDLCNFLNKIGAKISGIGTSIIKIVGVKVSALHSTTYKIMPDRIEAGTFMIASAVSGTEILIKNINYFHLDILISKMHLAGSKIEKIDGNNIKVFGNENIKPVSVETLPYPGFPTDMQAQWTFFMTQAKGNSLVTETVFENRFMHIPELQRMGAKLTIKGNTVFIEGCSKLTGAQVMATDLRASAALVLAGLVTEGETQISRIYHLDRGYENIEKKLNNLGANIKRIKE
jgi:UDP-N-acetylglucosamine 1-carboxyvinyltransferase